MVNEKYILIVDDNARNTFALAAVLGAKGFRNVCAASMNEAFKILEVNKEVGIILLDMMMPEMDGYEALAKIKTMNDLKNIPVIAVTAQAMPGDKERCLAAGADAYISKPVDIGSLLEHLYEKL